MATWETSAPVTFWRPNGLLTSSTNRVLSRITDDKDDSSTFEVNEVIAFQFRLTSISSTLPIAGKFLGTVTVDGVTYPVVQSDDSGFRYIAGLDPSTVSGQTLADSALNKSTFTVCFFPGTLIATPTGERKVEELVSGNLVLIGNFGAIPATWLGRRFARAVSVKWIGRQSVSTFFGPAERLMPVRFTAGSLGGGGNSFYRIAI